MLIILVAGKSSTDDDLWDKIVGLTVDIGGAIFEAGAGAEDAIIFGVTIGALGTELLTTSTDIVGDEGAADGAGSIVITIDIEEVDSAAGIECAITDDDLWDKIVGLTVDIGGAIFEAGAGAEDAIIFGVTIGALGTELLTTSTDIVGDEGAADGAGSIVITIDEDVVALVEDAAEAISGTAALITTGTETLAKPSITGAETILGTKPISFSTNLTKWAWVNLTPPISLLSKTKTGESGTGLHLLVTVSSTVPRITALSLKAATTIC